VQVEGDDRRLRILPDDRQVALLALDVEAFFVGRPAAEAAIASCSERNWPLPSAATTALAWAGQPGGNWARAFEAQARHRKRRAARRASLARDARG